ncbi:LOW QUALITY PROTEIN: hypothetical protein PHMEG_00018086 [Phytophthora megakarya]|uniref:Uncharacterized protein n=1 Tax=Phytophthora megakarya TaxID=4795 RepID=A0A225VV71_9STRA|nr:LOW QUALITY PROTEIN: hypothetical protein PHMEG_00018086 [Phytophthora megakarya]
MGVKRIHYVKREDGWRTHVKPKLYDNDDPRLVQRLLAAGAHQGMPVEELHGLVFTRRVNDASCCLPNYGRQCLRSVTILSGLRIYVRRTLRYILLVSTGVLVYNEMYGAGSPVVRNMGDGPTKRGGAALRGGDVGDRWALDVPGPLEVGELLTDGAPELTGLAIESLVTLLQAEQTTPMSYRLDDRPGRTISPDLEGHRGYIHAGQHSK